MMYLIVALLRIGYPFELEWMEGGSLDHVSRILAGQALYVSPSLDFVPYIYTPLYFYLAAGLCKTVGLSFIPLRLISFVSSLGCFAVVFLMVRRETRSVIAGFAASCLMAATFRLSGAWFDLARVDSLLLVLLLGSFYLVRSSDRRLIYTLAGLLLALAFLTKQIALVTALPVVFYAAFLDWRRSLPLLATFGGLVAVSTLVLDRIHDGWYMYYIYRLPRGHEIIASQFINFWIRDLLRPLPIAVVTAAFYLHCCLRKPFTRESLYYPMLTVGLVGSSLSARVHLGGYDNVLMPAYSVVAILFGLGVHDIASSKRAGPRGRTVIIGIYLASLIQFGLLRYDPTEQIPTGQDLTAGNELIGLIMQIEGEVLVPDHGFIAAMAGKRSYAHRMAMHDVLRGDEGEAKAHLVAEITEAISKKRFDAIILDSYWRKADIRGHYDEHRPIFVAPEVFWPVTGKRTRPTLLYSPKTEGH